ncbi:MAG: membrane protein insertion efficiency factor YidD [Mariprofundaceae bacterium]|nr:membrane protein insertion efficiency factor YidD [Mariprofundaceae bacterium]
MLKRCLIACVRFYRYFISPLLPARCRFYPTCSEYSLEALQRYGAMRGLFFSCRRICRCHPFCKGGYDPLP